MKGPKAKKRKSSNKIFKLSRDSSDLETNRNFPLSQGSEEPHPRKNKFRRWNKEQLSKIKDGSRPSNSKRLDSDIFLDPHADDLLRDQWCPVETLDITDLSPPSSIRNIPISKQKKFSEGEQIPEQKCQPKQSNGHSRNRLGEVGKNSNASQPLPSTSNIKTSHEASGNIEFKERGTFSTPAIAEITNANGGPQYEADHLEESSGPLSIKTHVKIIHTSEEDIKQPSMEGEVSIEKDWGGAASEKESSPTRTDMKLTFQVIQNESSSPKITTGTKELKSPATVESLHEERNTMVCPGQRKMGDVEHQSVAERVKYGDLKFMAARNERSQALIIKRTGELVPTETAERLRDDVFSMTTAGQRISCEAHPLSVADKENEKKFVYEQSQTAPALIATEVEVVPAKNLESSREDFLLTDCSRLCKSSQVDPRSMESRDDAFRELFRERKKIYSDLMDLEAHSAKIDNDIADLQLETERLEISNMDKKITNDELFEIGNEMEEELARLLDEAKGNETMLVEMSRQLKVREQEDSQSKEVDDANLNQMRLSARSVRARKGRKQAITKKELSEKKLLISRKTALLQSQQGETEKAEKELEELKKTNEILENRHRHVMRQRQLPRPESNHAPR